MSGVAQISNTKKENGSKRAMLRNHTRRVKALTGICYSYVIKLVLLACGPNLLDCTNSSQGLFPGAGDAVTY